MIPPAYALVITIVICYLRCSDHSSNDVCRELRLGQATSWTYVKRVTYNRSDHLTICLQFPERFYSLYFKSPRYDRINCCNCFSYVGREQGPVASECMTVCSVTLVLNEYVILQIQRDFEWQWSCV